MKKKPTLRMMHEVAREDKIRRTELNKKYAEFLKQEDTVERLEFGDLVPKSEQDVLIKKIDEAVTQEDLDRVAKVIGEINKEAEEVLTEENKRVEEKKLERFEEAFDEDEEEEIHLS